MGTGIILISLALLGFVIAIQQGTIITVENGFKQNIVKFGGGETITTYEIPEFLTPEQKAALAEYTDTIFYQEEIPVEYVDAGLEQRTIYPEGYNATSSEIDVNATELQQTILKTNTGSDTHQRGQIVTVTGKITKVTTPAPYFFNVIVSCCGMDSFRAMSAVETDAAGNFIIKIATTLKFPLGIWTVEISTVADDKTIMRTFYTFRLI